MVPPNHPQGRSSTGRRFSPRGGSRFPPLTWPTAVRWAFPLMHFVNIQTGELLGEEGELSRSPASLSGLCGRFDQVNRNAIKRMSPVPYYIGGRPETDFGIFIDSRLSFSLFNHRNISNRGPTKPFSRADEAGLKPGSPIKPTQ